MADEKRLERVIAQNRGEAAEWERKAVLAVKSGNDPLAKGSLRQLQQKIEDAARKRNQQTMTSLSDSSAFQVFDRIEAEADASGDKLLEDLKARLARLEDQTRDA